MKRLKATTTIGSAAHAPAPIRTELQLKQLRPYVSVILYDLRAWRDHSEDLVDEVEARIEATISSTHKQGDRLKDYGPIAKITFHRWITRGRWHSVQTVPSWMAEVKAESIPHEDHGSEGVNQEPIEASLRDVRHHLTLFLAKNGAAPNADSFGILLSTDPGIRREVADYLDVLGVPQVPEAELASTFLRGASRQAWLKGIHKPIVVKADAKTLVGLDLRNVLDPFGDHPECFRVGRKLERIAVGQLADAGPQAAKRGSEFVEVPLALLGGERGQITGERRIFCEQWKRDERHREYKQLVHA